MITGENPKYEIDDKQLHDNIMNLQNSNNWQIRAKLISDALNGIAYFDDSQICKLFIHKYYAKILKIIVILGNKGDNSN